MPAYHSKQNDSTARQVCSCFILPLRSDVRGPAPKTTEEIDIIDEILRYFKPNLLFRNYEVQGPADRVLIYGTLYVTNALQTIAKHDGKPDAAGKALYTQAISNFSIPGDANFALGGFFTAPAARAESDEIRAYFSQLRQEIGIRLVRLAYNADGSLNKWWMCWSKRKFLNKQID